MVDFSEYMCTRRKRDKGSPKLFSRENKMHPGDVPECLKGLYTGRRNANSKSLSSNVYLQET